MIIGIKALPFLLLVIVGFFCFVLLTWITWLPLVSVSIRDFWIFFDEDRSEPSIDLKETYELTPEDLKMPSPFYVDKKLFGILFMWLKSMFEDGFFFTNFLFFVHFGLASGVLSVFWLSWCSVMFMNYPSNEHMLEFPCSSLAASLADIWCPRLSKLLLLLSLDPNPKLLPLRVPEVCGGNLVACSVSVGGDETPLSWVSRPELPGMKPAYGKGIIRFCRCLFCLLLINLSWVRASPEFMKV